MVDFLFMKTKCDEYKIMRFKQLVIKKKKKKRIKSKKQLAYEICSVKAIRGCKLSYFKDFS